MGWRGRLRGLGLVALSAAAVASPAAGQNIGADTTADAPIEQLILEDYHKSIPAFHANGLECDDLYFFPTDLDGNLADFSDNWKQNLIRIDTIWYRKHDPEERLRTMMHELGHCGSSQIHDELFGGSWNYSGDVSLIHRFEQAFEDGDVQAIQRFKSDPELERVIAERMMREGLSEYLGRTEARYDSIPKSLSDISAPRWIQRTIQEGGFLMVRDMMRGLPREAFAELVKSVIEQMPERIDSSYLQRYSQRVRSATLERLGPSKMVSAGH